MTWTQIGNRCESVNGIKRGLDRSGKLKVQDILLLLVFASGVVIFLWTGRSDGSYGDFAPVYGSVRALAAGLNPYRVAEVQQQLLASGYPQGWMGPEFWQTHQLLYPPLTYYLLWPLSFAGYHLAGLVWFWLSAVALACAGLTAAWLGPVGARRFALAGAGAILATSGGLLRLGQLSVLAIALVVTGSVLLLARRWLPPGGVLLFVACGLKPQLALPIVLFLCFPRPSRRPACAALAAFILLSGAAAAVLASSASSRHWVEDLREQVALAAPAGPQSRIDTGVIHLEGLTSLISADPVVYDSMDALVCVAILALLVMGFRRRREARSRDWMAVATMAFLTLLLTYHRTYDMRLQMLSLPALGLLWRTRRKLAWVLTLLSASLLFSTALLSLRWGEAHLSSPVTHSLWFRILVERQQAVLVLAAAVAWAIAMPPEPASRSRLEPGS